MLHMVFDVESISLHGEAFSVGYVVVGDMGERLGEGVFHCDPDLAEGRDANRDWVRENVPELDMSRGYCARPVDVCFAFWDAWQRWRERGAMLWADCAWPVEARFLARCVDTDLAENEWRGPYPLHEIATLAFACGHDPMATAERLPDELPAHNPLNDARQSARLLLKYLGELKAVQHA